MAVRSHRCLAGYGRRLVGRGGLKRTIPRCSTRWRKETANDDEGGKTLAAGRNGAGQPNRSDARGSILEHHDETTGRHRTSADAVRAPRSRSGRRAGLTKHDTSSGCRASSRSSITARQPRRRVLWRTRRRPLNTTRRRHFQRIPNAGTEPPRFILSNPVRQHRLIRRAASSLAR